METILNFGNLLLVKLRGWNGVSCKIGRDLIEEFLKESGCELNQIVCICISTTAIYSE